MDAVLRLLLESNDYLSGEKIGKILNITRAGVWKHIEKIRERGFEISSVTRKGYKIISLPENMIIPELVSLKLNSTLEKDLEIEVVYFDKIPSTNTWLKERAVRGLDKICVAVTDEQFGGRGRLKRGWSSIPGKDLTFSIGIPLDREISEFYKFTILCATSVRKTVAEILPEKNVKIKWPNDIYINEKKVCGILSEMITQENIIELIIIGIGLNVNSHLSLENATSIMDERFDDVDRNELLAKIIAQIIHNLSLYNENKFELIYNDWKSNLLWLGDTVFIETGFGRVEGVFSDVRPDGGVVIATSQADRVFYSGDIVKFRR
jgi:BirA family biotin operon repressor/biotin-[acetyl-CoA-carboxylase] ligase